METLPEPWQRYEMIYKYHIIIIYILSKLNEATPLPHTLCIFGYLFNFSSMVRVEAIITFPSYLGYANRYGYRANDHQTG